MNGDKLYRSIGLIDDEFIEEAEETASLSKHPDTKRMCIRLVSMAACISLIIGGSWLYINKMNLFNSSSGTVKNQVIYLTKENAIKYGEACDEAEGTDSKAGGSSYTYNEENGQIEDVQLGAAEQCEFTYGGKQYEIVSADNNELLDKRSIPNHIDKSMTGKKIGKFDLVFKDYEIEINNIVIFSYQKDNLILLLTDNHGEWMYGINLVK